MYPISRTESTVEEIQSQAEQVENFKLKDYAEKNFQTHKKGTIRKKTVDAKSLLTYNKVKR